MDQTLIVRGRYADRTSITDGPLPDAEGAAERAIAAIASAPRAFPATMRGGGTS